MSFDHKTLSNTRFITQKHLIITMNSLSTTLFILHIVINTPLSNCFYVGRVLPICTNEIQLSNTHRSSHHQTTFYLESDQHSSAVLAGKQFVFNYKSLGSSNTGISHFKYSQNV